MHIEIFINKLSLRREMLMKMKTRFIKQQSLKRGLPPGSLVSVNDNLQSEMRMSIIDYNADQFKERREVNLEECLKAAEDPALNTWIQIEGLSDQKVIEAIGREFGIQSLWLEDVLNTDHRPKLEELHDLLFVILKSLRDPKSTDGQIRFEQVSLFLGESFVISFQETSSKIFDAVKDRLKNFKGKVRVSQVDYLFYALVDSVVDNYFSTLESLGNEIEKLEDSLTLEPQANTPQKLLSLRSDVLYLNRAVFPLRETLSHLSKMDRQDISPGVKTYLRDAYDHTVYVADVVENYRQLLNSMMDTYQSILNQKTNEIIKFLTIFSVFFIPPTFIVGVYGMNFDIFPELHWRYGYAFAWGIILTFFVGLFVFFKKRKWL